MSWIEWQKDIISHVLSTKKRPKDIRFSWTIFMHALIYSVHMKRNLCAHCERNPTCYLQQTTDARAAKNPRCADLPVSCVCCSRSLSVSAAPNHRPPTPHHTHTHIYAHTSLSSTPSSIKGYSTNKVRRETETWVSSRLWRGWSEREGRRLWLKPCGPWTLPSTETPQQDGMALLLTDAAYPQAPVPFLKAIFSSSEYQLPINSPFRCFLHVFKGRQIPGVFDQFNVILG